MTTVGEMQEVIERQGPADWSRTNISRWIRLGRAVEALYVVNREIDPSAEDGAVGWFLDSALKQQIMTQLEQVYVAAGLEPPPPKRRSP